MTNDVLSVLNEKRPVRRLNRLAVGYVEKLAAMTLAKLRFYSDVGITQLNSALEVRDVESLRDYVAGQRELLKTIGELLLADARKLVQMGFDFGTEVRSIAREGLAATAPKTA